MAKHRVTINELQTLAKSKGGKCLSDNYRDYESQLQWQCAEGHQWWASSNNVKYSGVWCPECLAFEKQKKLMLGMQELAKAQGGKCLSKEYRNEQGKLQWECVKGHQWWASAKNVKSNKCWCPECSDNPQKKLTIEGIRELAKSKGGKCLSEKYVGNRFKLQWECAKGHQWWACTQNIKYGGTWCPTCGAVEKSKKLRLPIEELQDLAKSKGGKFLSGDYKDYESKLKWECSEGHQWWSSANNVKYSGTWCTTCLANEKQKKIMLEMQELAKAKGGKCLSQNYAGALRKLQWECAKGHQWWAVPNPIKANKCWCPSCNVKKKKTIEEMRQLAISKGGKCISTEYVNSELPLKWECNKGHTWEAIYRSIMVNENFCQYCYREDNRHHRINRKMSKGKRGGKLFISSID
jgi:hypothetical protein